MGYRLDEIDERILYHLARDARNTTARAVAEEMGVSPGTVGNRIERLEDAGVLEGYHADIDYEKADGLLTHIYICHAPTPERERLAREALELPGVVNVRRAMLGRENLHVVAVGTDTRSISDITQSLTDLGLDIEREGLMEAEDFRPFEPYGPEGTAAHTGRDYMTVAGDAKLTELRVPETASVVGMSIGEAAAEGVLSDDILVVAIERGSEMITPRGAVEFERGDLVTILFRDGVDERVVEDFGGDVVNH